ncbi:phosphoglycolate phosphatase [Bacillus sp. G3(2015)]|uniref:phosphoglycolate phosphatase n=1 Tax=Bacillus sp. G3(2015) TaxID=1706731 RepID=UPI000A4F0A7C|nr:phosphoglycolate phosphatase [Bacillus sp. G3(2015)]
MKNLFRYILLSFSFITIPILFIVFVSSHIVPQKFLNEEWPNVKRTAELVTIGYFKKEKNLDIIVEIVKPPEEYYTHEVYVSGYASENKNQKISVIVNFNENYIVTNLSDMNEN